MLRVVDVVMGGSKTLHIGRTVKCGVAFEPFAVFTTSVPPSHLHLPTTLKYNVVTGTPGP